MKCRYYALDTRNNSYRELIPVELLLNPDRKPNDREILVTIPEPILKGLNLEEVENLVKWYATSMNQGLDRLRKIATLDSKVG